MKSSISYSVPSIVRTVYIECYVSFQPGHFIRVSEPSDLRSKMGLYYTYMSRTGSKPKVVFSVPYKGFFGVGKHHNLLLLFCDMSLYCIKVRVFSLLVQLIVLDGYIKCTCAVYIYFSIIGPAYVKCDVMYKHRMQNNETSFPYKCNETSFPYK